ncbi:MAG TPA: hypothetical protein VLX28_24060, partial [Thermoanaerobaculia bacterium]|nr:hypothetical protein [Thermoanaerobaculia bacterium]
MTYRFVRRASFSTSHRARALGVVLSALLVGPPLTPATAAEPTFTALPSARALGIPIGPLERPGDAPPDRTPYQRALVAGERPEIPKTLATGTLVDLVVASGLGASDSFGDQETSIAIDPNNPNHITVSAFSGGWGSFAPLWVSTDGGTTWAKRFTLSVPPGRPEAIGCP